MQCQIDLETPIVNGDQLHFWKPTTTHYCLPCAVGDSKRHNLKRTARTLKSRKKLIVPSWGQGRLRCYWYEESHTQNSNSPKFQRSCKLPASSQTSGWDSMFPKLCPAPSTLYYCPLGKMALQMIPDRNCT